MSMFLFCCDLLFLVWKTLCISICHHFRLFLEFWLVFFIICLILSALCLNFAQFFSIIPFNFNVTFTTWTWRSWSIWPYNNCWNSACCSRRSKQANKDPRAPCLGIWIKKDLTLPLFVVTIILINFVDGTCWQYSGNQLLWGLESINFMFFFILCFPSHEKPHRSYLPMCITTDFIQPTPIEGGQSRVKVVYIGQKKDRQRHPWSRVRKLLSNLCWSAQVAAGHKDAS